MKKLSIKNQNIAGLAIATPLKEALLITTLLLATPLMAAESDDSNNTSVGIDVTVDNSNNRDSVFSLTHFLDEVNQLTLGYSRSLIQGDPAIGEADYHSRGYSVALENLGDTLVNSGWEYEKYGKPDELNIDALRAMIALNIKSTRWELHPQVQKIRFENVNTPIPALTQIDFTSMGAALNFSAMISESFVVQLEYLKNKYYTTFQNFQTALENAQCKARYSTRISSAANNIVATLDDERKTLSASWQPAWGSVGVSVQRSHGYISACNTDQAVLQLGVDLNESWAASTSAGTSVSSISDRVNFASLGFIYSF